MDVRNVKVIQDLFEARLENDFVDEFVKESVEKMKLNHHNPKAA